MPNQLPEFGFIRLKNIIGDPKSDPPIPAIIPISKSAWNKGVKNGIFPAPIRNAFGINVTVWSVEEIRALVNKSIE